MSTQQNSPLFTVEDRFQITGRGLILVPGPGVDRLGQDGREYACQVLIKRPDGTEILAEAHFIKAHTAPLETQLRSIERETYPCLLSNLSKPDVPVGSVLYLIRDFQDVC